jgi:2-haloacid dehalogenase
MVRVCAVIFDAHGTLSDVHAPQPGETWPQIRIDWRPKHVEYNWICSLAGPGLHRDFCELTPAVLSWTTTGHEARALTDLPLTDRQRDPRPDGWALLRQIGDWQFPTGMLSDDEPDMLADAVRSAGSKDLLDFILSIEIAGAFKPTLTVYRLAAAQLRLTGSRIGFVSSNPRGVFGANAEGFQVFWVNRTNQPDEYGLPRVATQSSALAILPAALSPRRAS